MAAPSLDLIAAARNGSLTRKHIYEFKNKGGDINAKASNGLTLLCAAAMGGSAGTVRSLLRFEAGVNKASDLDCTPLWFATRILDKEKAYRVVNHLLSAGAQVEVTSHEKMMNTTPLMNSLRANQGLKVIGLILAKKASPDFVSDAGKSRKQANATAVANFLGNSRYEMVLKHAQDVLEQNKSRLSFISGINNLLSFMIAVVNKFTNNSLQKTFRVAGEPKQGTVYDAPKFDPEAFKNEINQQIISSGLNAFFPAESTFLQAVITKANTFAKRGESALAAPEYLPGLTQLSLYQPIIFCDNSGSMRTGTRIDSMIEIVTRITEITNHLVPDDEGIEIRFLNTRAKEQGLYSQYKKIRTAQQATSMLASADYSGPTELGTVLKAQVLQPHVYDIIDNGRRLERPLFISIITDGCPTEVPENHLDEVIIECKQKLRERGYDLRIVNFQISQIGDDDSADAFLHRIQTDPRIKDHLYVTTGKLDEEFRRYNDNEEDLEIYLYKVLMTPILSAT
ncbi:hypothetical protein BDZ91DRAFT_700035 [Kalaharituber pfeilii]|nr:hypothetical protein BDZ91DRAFT_700035 [Kalaharituber pfeilii]